jgi:carboxyl-terminal processing protease
MMKRFAVVSAAFALSTAPLAGQESGAFPMERAPQLDVMADAIDAISRMHMESFSDSTLWEAAIDGLIGALNDPYAVLFTPQEAEAWEEDTTGDYSGIGLQITLLNDEVTVTAVFRGFPAFEHGIAVGDVIVGVNDHDSSEWGTDMAADSIRGPVGTNVFVQIKRAGYDDPIGYDITRAEVHVPAVDYGVLEGDIGYVIMDRVARNAAREMNEALAELAGRRGLIIDLRRNPGGFLDESLMLADLFLKPGSVLASTTQRVAGGSADEPETDSYTDRWPQLVPDLPVVILVDEFTASGAEILAGALQDYDRAVVLGQRTFGKGVVQTVMNLPHGRRLRFTTGSWLTPLGRSLQRERDGQGVPVQEIEDSFPRVQTASGRGLIDGGGIFPDLVIEDDTLTTVEQDFIRAANVQQFPLNLRIAEYGLGVAAERDDDTSWTGGVSDAQFAAFMTQLEEEGLESERFADPTVRSYLRWRLDIAVAQRMADVAAEVSVRTARDPVLAEAIRLLEQTGSQAELFRTVDARPGAPQAPPAHD